METITVVCLARVTGSIFLSFFARLVLNHPIHHHGERRFVELDEVRGGEVVGPIFHQERIPARVEVHYVRVVEQTPRTVVETRQAAWNRSLATTGARTSPVCLDVLEPVAQGNASRGVVLSL